MKNSARRATLLGLSVPLLLAAACAGAKSTNGDDDHTSGSGGTGGSAVSGGSGGSVETGGSGGSTTSGGAGGASGGTTASGGSSGTGGAGSAGAPQGQGGAGGVGGTAGVGGSAGGAGGSAGGTGATGGSSAGAAGSGVGAQGGGAGAGGSGAGGAGATAGAGMGTGDGSLGNGMMTGTGESSERYATTEVGRNGVPYELITNGWGPGFQSHTVSWNGTSFIVEAMSGTRGSGGQPASYPSVFCGKYSVMQVPACGLPKPIADITALKTGWRWNANGNTGAYNAAYDIWLGTDTGFGMYLMVWLRDPPTEQPAGSLNTMFQGVTVANMPGVWDIWSGTVNNRPIINWVRKEGMDSSEIEFDVMDIIRDAQMRGLTITGTQVNAVAVGFEIWSGPITNLESTDFYVDVK